MGEPDGCSYNGPNVDGCFSTEVFRLTFVGVQYVSDQNAIHRYRITEIARIDGGVAATEQVRETACKEITA
jgi:hypothetical protein